MKNNKRNNSIIIGVCFLLLGCITGCDDYERKGKVTPEITVNPHSLSLFVGETAQLTAGPSELNFSWNSEDPEVATVDGSGFVTAVGVGNSFIIVRSGDMICRVPVESVEKIPLTGFTLSDVEVDVNPRGRRMVVPVLDPPDANDASAPMWRSLNDEVATVDYKGEITGWSVGTTEIVCTINGMEQSVEVTVWLTKPFNGPHIFSADEPYLLKFIDFDFGGEGNAYHDSDNGNNGGNNYRSNNGDPNGGGVDIGGDLAVGWTNGGEWLIYTIEVHDAGDYYLSLDLAGDGTSNIRYEIDEVNATGTIFIPSTGGWGNWVWQDIPDPIPFTEGVHKLRFYLESAGTNFRTMKFTYKDPNALDPNVPIVDSEFDLDKHSVSTNIDGEDFNKMFFSLIKDTEYTLSGVLADAGIVFNVDFFERVSANRAKFLGETGDYFLYYNPVRNIVIISPDVTPELPDYVVMKGVGIGYPTKVSESTIKSSYPNAYLTTFENWDDANVMRYILFRKISSNVFQGTVSMPCSAQNWSWVFSGFKIYEGVGKGDDNQLLANYFTGGISGTATEIIDELTGDDGDFTIEANLPTSVYRFTVDMNAKSIKIDNYLIP